MAKINNQAVIQKLIDELGLYPGKDAIPMELAEKILPTFQVNSQDITMSNEPANVVRNSGFQVAATPQTIYTTPVSGKFYLTNVWASSSIFNAGAASGTTIVSVVIDGATQNILTAFLDNGAGGVQRSEQALNLQNPVLIDAGTTIIANGSANTTQNAGIVGYHIAV